MSPAGDIGCLRACLCSDASAAKDSGGGKDNYYQKENPRHNSFRNRFDINEEVLKVGARYFAEVVVEAMNKYSA